MTRWRGGFASLTPRSILLVAMSLGVLWRLVLTVWIVPAWEGSSHLAPFPDDYPALAHSLLEHGSLGYGPGRGADPTTARGPGFPMWLALGITIGGGDGRWLGFWSSVPILILAPILARRAWLRFGSAAAVASFLFLVFHPFPGVLSSRVMSDEFHAACGFAAILLWDRAMEARGNRGLLAAIAAGALLALQMLTRSSGLLFLLALLLVGLGRSPRRPLIVAVLVLCSLLPPLAWSVRSSRLEGRAVFVHSLLGYNFWLGEGFDRFGHNLASPESWPRVLDLLASKGRMPPERKKDFYYPDLGPREMAQLEANLQDAAMERVVQAPLSYGSRVLRGVYRFWIQAQSGPRTVQYALLLLPVVALIFPVFRPGNFRRLCADRVFCASVAAVLLHNVAYAAVLAMARFSVQVYPEVAWLLAAGMGCRWHREPAPTIQERPPG